MAPSSSVPKSVLKMMVFSRFYHASLVNMAMANSSTASLAKLRKMTGYSMSNCKKALQMHPENLEKAEEWLHEEAKKQGWTKIANLEHKPAIQGLVGIHILGSNAAMVEVNCETDFVARNTEFQAYVGKVLMTSLKEADSHPGEGECCKIHIDGSRLSKLDTESGTLGDLNALAVGKFGEKTVLRRAVCFKAGQNVFLSSFSHPSTTCSEVPAATLGRYGGIVAFRPTKTIQELDQTIIDELGKQLCQHIVGMNPESIGTMREEKLSVLEEEEYGVKLQQEDMKEDIIIGDPQPSNEGQVEEDVGEQGEKAIDANETQLLRQQFLLDPNITVGELLRANSLEVLDFHRFECGESDVKPN